MKFSDIPKYVRDKMILDEFIIGNGFVLKQEDGTFERIDPVRVILNPVTKTFEIKEATKDEWGEFMKSQKKRIGCFRKNFEDSINNSGVIPFGMKFKFTEKEPDMKDWDEPPKLELQFKPLDKKRVE